MPLPMLSRDTHANAMSESVFFVHESFDYAARIVYNFDWMMESYVRIAREDINKDKSIYLPPAVQVDKLNQE